MIKFFGAFFAAILLMGIYFSLPEYDQTVQMIFTAFTGLFIGFLVYLAAK